MSGSAFNLNLSADWQMFINAGMGWDALSQNARAGNGYARYAPSSAKMLTSAPAAGVALPTEARHALLAVSNFPVRFRTDGTNPTATEGILLPVGFWVFENQRPLLEQMRFIDTAAGASEVTVMYGA